MNERMGLRQIAQLSDQQIAYMSEATSLQIPGPYAELYSGQRIVELNQMMSRMNMNMMRKHLGLPRIPDPSPAEIWRRYFGEVDPCDAIASGHRIKHGFDVEVIGMPMPESRLDACVRTALTCAAVPPETTRMDSTLDDLVSALPTLVKHAAAAWNARGAEYARHAAEDKVRPLRLHRFSYLRGVVRV